MVVLGVEDDDDDDDGRLGGGIDDCCMVGIFFFCWYGIGVVFLIKDHRFVECWMFYFTVFESSCVCVCLGCKKLQLDIS
jgi:hypothetical protein